MIIEIKIPSPGESINEVEIATWFVKEGDLVEKDQEIAELESEKATLALIAEESGKIQELSPEGEALEVGSTACKIDTSFKVDKKEKTTPESGIQKEEPSNQIVSPEQEKQKSPEIPVAKNETPNDYAAVKVSPVAANMMKDLNIKYMFQNFKWHNMKQLWLNGI
jgi:2-oxoglutarate dehydrogenase E2 component (dihydrolipoamide succinyltransferase)